MMTVNEAYQWLVSVTGVEDDPNWANNPPMMKAIAMVNRITGGLERGYNYLASETLEDDAVLISAAELFFDRYVMPINFSEVPDALGTFVKMQARASIAPIIAQLATEVKSRYGS